MEQTIERLCQQRRDYSTAPRSRFIIIAPTLDNRDAPTRRRKRRQRAFNDQCHCNWYSPLKSLCDREIIVIRRRGSSVDARFFSASTETFVDANFLRKCKSSRPWSRRLLCYQLRGTIKNYSIDDRRADDRCRLPSSLPPPQQQQQKHPRTGLRYSRMIEQSTLNYSVWRWCVAL